MGYCKFGWAANQISEEDMAHLYHLKKATKKHITTMVSEAVKLYLSQKDRSLAEIQTNTFLKGKGNVQKSTENT
ncbi:MAG TPA: hypothetical protein ACFYEK_08420 [Candidatus Wunengus sp. YC60]|uniref:hypothetical protein n=1 Tax=Candidatus Wunengus sp. YC60 TaxID=3367697 RepID=UPI004028D6FC